MKYIFGAIEELKALTGNADCVIITDSNMAAAYTGLLGSYKTVVVPAGEEGKNWQMIESIAYELLQFETHRKTFVVGIGGGVITDITGFVASVYMRGVPFGFVPTTLLAMIDAAIGGKNGVNLGSQKNFLGSVQQPQFLLFDLNFLATLPETEWSNGFAEIIKYACIFDKALFNELEQRNIEYYKQDKTALQDLIRKCCDWKNKVVQQDEKETGIRKLLNFGHTAGHAFETLYTLPHGQAVGLGMIVACIVSGLHGEETKRLSMLLQKYQLPVHIPFDTEEVMNVLQMDKKRNGNQIDYIVLKEIGEGAIKSLPFDTIRQALLSFKDVSNH